METAAVHIVCRVRVQLSWCARSARDATARSATLCFDVPPAPYSDTCYSNSNERNTDLAV
jgi:hypothetical protein